MLPHKDIGVIRRGAITWWPFRLFPSRTGPDVPNSGRTTHFDMTSALCGQTKQGPVTAIDAIRAIVSDVDNTLLGNIESLERFASWHSHSGGDCTLIYASGRFYDSIVESIDTTALPEPDVVIGGVGTEVRAFPTGEPIGDWLSRFKDRFDAQAVVEALRRHPGLELQPEACNSDFKVSFFLHDADPGDLFQVRLLLAEASIDAELVYSSSRDLDVLPAGVNKGSAARFAIESLGVRRDQVVVCGDSANDLSMFRHGFRGVVVGNAHEDLLALSDANVHHAEQTYAAGVLEGLERWGATVLEPSERALVGAGSH